VRPRHLIFKETEGLNNLLDPARVPYDKERGLSTLTASVNVDVDNSGNIRRRKGFTLKKTGAFHSLYCVTDYCLCASGDALLVFGVDYETTAIRNVTVGARLDYKRVKDKVFYCNGFENGYVEDKLSYAWEFQDYVGPTTTREFSNPPIGHLLEVWDGRMWIAQESILFPSEPFAYSMFDLGSNYIESSDRIRMVKAVRDGMYVGTAEEIIFVGGTTGEPTRDVVADYGVVEGTGVRVSGDKLNLPAFAGKSVLMFVTNEGICVGGPGGTFLNLTREKLDFVVSNEGAATVIEDRYICTLFP
jgi:hypothetical protein